MNLKHQELEIFDYKKDPLLSDDKVFIDGYLNIYCAMVKKQDMFENKKGIILKKCAYIRDENKEIQKLIYTLYTNNFITLRQALSNYLNISRIRKDTFYNWIKKDIYPLPLIRVICLLLNIDLIKITKDKIITDYCNRSHIRLPLFYEEVTSDFLAYFVGLHLGDGTLNEQRWKIVDGDHEQENLQYTKIYLTLVKKRLEGIFSMSSYGPFKIKNKNAYEFIVANKWFCRYLHFVYKLEYKEKQNPVIPAIFQNKRRLVLRGIFDTDGSIKDYRVSVGSKYLSLYIAISKVLSYYNLRYKEKRIQINRKNPLYILEIQKEDITKFINIIGFSHPRKVLEIKKYLLTTSSARRFVRYSESYNPRISDNKFLNLCTYLRPIKDSGKVHFISAFNNLDENKRMQIINDLKINFETDKEPNSKGYINSYKIQKLLSKYCEYENTRNPKDSTEIKKLIDTLNCIWN